MSLLPRSSDNAAPTIDAILKIQGELLAQIARLVLSLDGTSSGSHIRVFELLTAGLHVLRGADGRSKAIMDRRDEFLKRYEVRAVPPSRVTFALSRRVSIAELLLDAQSLADDLYGVISVNVDYLSRWSEDPAFATRVDKRRILTIDGNVEKTVNMSRGEQIAFLTERHLDMPALSYLAAAHAVFLVATNTSLFGGNIVRALDGSLGFTRDGLYSVGTYGSDGPGSRVTAAATLSFKLERARW